MKKAIIKIIIFLFAITRITAQVNLVSNGDFEIYSSIPTDIMQSNLAIGWNNVNGHYGQNSYANADYFYYPLSGILNWFDPINPISGNGQMGQLLYYSYDQTTFPNYREYISTQLLSIILPGHLYKLSFYLTNGKDTMYSQACNNFGIHFSSAPLTQLTFEPLSVVPQIEINQIIYFWNSWQHFSFNYIADSSYKYITIGDFRDDAHTLISSTGKNGAYYFIDKIEIIPILNIIGDTVICKGDTATLTATADSTFKWALAIKPDSIISTNQTIKVKPYTTTTYIFSGNNNDTAWFTVNVVNPPIINLGNDTTVCIGKAILLNPNINNAIYQWQDSSANTTYKVNYPGVYWVKTTIPPHCSNWDTIIVNYQNCETGGIFIPNAFTPNSDGSNDIFKVETVLEFKEFKLMIFDRTSELIFESTDINKGWDGTFKNKTVPLGVYIYMLTGIIKDTGEQIKRTGSITVLR